MDVRSLANGATSSTVNANQPVTVQASTGFTVGSGARQTPTYAAPVSGFAQIQALNDSDLKQLDGLNIQTTVMAIYLRGALNQVVRPNQKGGDLVTWNGQTWLIVKILESWPLWTKAAMTLQGGG